MTRLKVFAMVAVSAAGLLASRPALAAILVIDSVSTTGSTLDSITVGSVAYSDLTAPTSFVNNKAGTDWLHVAATAPADLAEAVGSFDLRLGSLNNPLEAQFGGALTDTSLIYVIINSANAGAGDVATVHAIDGSGTRLGSSSFNALNFISLTTPILFGPDTYNRTTNGSAGNSLDRVLVGATFTLTDLGIEGLGAVGIEFDTTEMDFQEVGIAAVIPEPSTAVISILGLFALIRFRKPTSYAGVRC